MTAPNLADLRARLESANGPDPQLDGLIDSLADYEGEAWPAPYTASIDAALTLVDRVLPGWVVRLDIDQGSCEAELWTDVRATTLSYSANGKPPPLAILLALVTALQAQDHNDG